MEPEQVGLASTGVIAAELPRDKVVGGARAAIGALRRQRGGLRRGDHDHRPVAEARVPRGALAGGVVRLSAQAKGAGMISPRYATMFCFVQTDAGLAAETLELLTGVCVKRSFDRISVDGQLSTSDTVFFMANGASGVRVEPQTPDELILGEAIDALMRQLAMLIVPTARARARRPGRRARRADDVERVARSVANSPLVKTALHGADPNYGRILQAAGQAMRPVPRGPRDRGPPGGERGGGDRRSERVRASSSTRAAATRWSIALTLPGEGGETEVFFSDLSHEYVTINAEYTT